MTLLSKPWTLIAMAAALAVAAGCSKPKDFHVAGAHWLEPEAGAEDPLYDVLAYPMDERELAYFESALPAIEAAAAEHPELWEEVSSAESPVEAARPNAIWRASGALGEDVIAATSKLTFLREFSGTAQPVEEEMRTNLAWLEQRLEQGEADAELWRAADTIRAMLKVIQIHREEGAFGRYAANPARYDAALDRFTAIGEQ